MPHPLHRDGPSKKDGSPALRAPLIMDVRQKMKSTTLLLVCLFAVTAGAEPGASLPSFPSREKLAALWKDVGTGKGAFVAKVRAGKGVDYVFFAGTNRPRFSSELVRGGVRFPSLEDAAVFAFMRPHGAILMFPRFDYPHDDAKVLMPFTDEEKSALEVR